MLSSIWARAFVATDIVVWQTFVSMTNRTVGAEPQRSSEALASNALHVLSLIERPGDCSAEDPISGRSAFPRSFV